MNLAAEPIDPRLTDGETTVAFSNPYITVEMRPSEFGPFTVIAQASTQGSVVFAEDTEGRVALVRQNRYAVGQQLWELPRGGCNGDETLLDAAVRELFEETGIRAEPEEFIDLGSWYGDSGAMQTRIGAFYVKVDTIFDETTDDAQEITDRVWIPRRELHRACLDGRITDASTIIACFKTHGMGIHDDTPEGHRP